MATGWTFEQIGRLTFPQLFAAQRGIERQMKRLYGSGKGPDSGKDRKAVPDKDGIRGATALEQALALAKKRTGRSKFDLREVLGCQ